MANSRIKSGRGSWHNAFPIAETICADKDNQYTKLIFDQKTIEKQRKKAVKLTKKLEKKKVQNWFFNFIEQGNPLLAKSWLEQKLKQL